MVMMTLTDIFFRAYIDRMAKKGVEVNVECSMPEFEHVSEVDLVEATSKFIDLDFGLIGSVVVATGIVLAKPFVIAFF